MERHPDVDAGRAARRREGPVSQEPDEARALKAPPILPPLMIWDAGRVALLGQGTWALENGAPPRILGSRFLGRRGIAEKESEWRRGGGGCRHSVLRNPSSRVAVMEEHSRSNALRRPARAGRLPDCTN